MITNPSLPFFTAGDSVDFTLTNPSYSPASWSLTYVIAAATPVSKAATPEVDASGNPVFRVQLGTADTGAITPGRYATFFIFTLDTQRVTRPGLNVTVFPNPASAVEPSWSQQTILAIQDALTALSTSPVSQVSVNGQTFTVADVEKLMRWRDRLLVDSANELAAIGRPSGLNPRRHRVIFRA